MVVARTRITADEYFAERDPSDTRRVELIDGEIVMSRPKLWHQRVTGEIHGALHAWEKTEPGRGLAALALDVQFDEDNVFVPDVLWYAQARAPRLTDEPPYAIPDLAVEVLSPSTWRYNVGRKKARYEALGVRELWLVDFTVVLVYRRSDPKRSTFDVELELTSEETLRSPLLPGFALPLAGLGVALPLDLRAVLAELVAHRAADLADRAVGLEGRLDEREQVLLALRGLAQLAQAPVGLLLVAL